ncbi:transport and Golgi organization protein 2 [Colletotrichum spaethianum]|uniref:Transport and Golgi organization protein 2 n=1 Tax=Colletotrichum spaethianum TaxID=700344 RepID=A0AA37URX5_9PEZI|nr:transport and Golgi organization protein 2 [Colletotrichum spaethianum]GKT51587.1 transport and Golgi organization protein 2 [Colletotrichum spaethianum]
MASNQPVGAAGPLPAMQELSPTTFLYDPPSAVPDPNSPKLIAIFSWMSAQDVHIAKYTSRYMALYPSASILLVKCPFVHTLSTRISKRQIKPAVPIIRTLADSTLASEARPQLLLHVFSNGGATNFAKFLEMYADADRADRLALPPHVTLYDSCPGGFHWMRSYRAISASMPRILAPLAHVFIGWFWLFHVPFGRVGFFGKMWAALRQKALLASERRRAYLYSKEDEMIHWSDVERHAKESKEVGFQVRAERFDGSQHVAHAKLNPSRYWSVVKELWDEDLKKIEPPAKPAQDPTPEPPKAAPEPEAPKVALEQPKITLEPEAPKAAPPMPALEPVKSTPEPEAPKAATAPPPEVKPPRPKKAPTPPPTIQ